MSRHQLGSSFGTSRRGSVGVTKPDANKQKKKNQNQKGNQNNVNGHQPKRPNFAGNVGAPKTSPGNTTSVYVQAAAGSDRQNNKSRNKGKETPPPPILAADTRANQLDRLDDETQERVAELYEDLQEFKKAEHRYRESEHKSLEWEALKQYERTENEIELLLNPPKPRRTPTPCVSMLCLPCLIVAQCCLCVSTGRVGEYSKKKKITAAVTHELAQVGTDFTQKYIVGSKRLGGIGRWGGSGKRSLEMKQKKTNNKPRLSSSGAALDEYGFPLQWEGSVY